jgi:hypothetical protein
LQNTNDILFAKNVKLVIVELDLLTAKAVRNQHTLANLHHRRHNGAITSAKTIANGNNGEFVQLGHRTFRQNNATEKKKKKKKKKGNTSANDTKDAIKASYPMVLVAGFTF